MQSLGADLGGALVAGGIGAIGNIAGGVIQGEYNKDINASNIEAQAKANESNEAFAEKWNQKNYDFSKAAQEWQQQFAENQFNWNKYSAENAAQIRVADLKAAGLNPVLAAGSGSYSPSSVSAAQVSSPSHQGANQRGGSSQSTNLGLGNFGSAVVQSAMIGAQLRATNAETLLRNEQAEYYEALANSIPRTTEVAERTQAVGERVAEAQIKTEEKRPALVEAQAKAEEARVPLIEAQVKTEEKRPAAIVAETRTEEKRPALVEAQTQQAQSSAEHQGALTKLAQYELEMMAPARYQQVLLENELTKGRITLTQKEIILKDLEIWHSNAERLNYQTKIDQRRNDVTAGSLQNTITQFYVDQVASGNNPQDITATRVTNWVDVSFPGMSESTKRFLSSWIVNVISLVGGRK